MLPIEEIHRLAQNILDIPEICRREFLPSALKGWRTLGPEIRAQFKARFEGLKSHTWLAQGSGETKTITKSSCGQLATGWSIGKDWGQILICELRINVSLDHHT
ncbi:MAG: hypothetical protein JRJ85_20655 [Deltaproteobacteria bacterium]|nr:hypothetical protein [Deltaproteobacteria bacterium]